MSIKLLAELHDIDTMLAQRWTHWWTWVGFTGCNLQLDISIYLLCHFLTPS
jgi:hypothetical protein